jgi:hypothetical protein
MGSSGASSSGRGQITEQFAQTGRSVFLVKDLSGIRQTAGCSATSRVRHLAVLDTRGTVRFEDGHAGATYRTPPTFG